MMREERVVERPWKATEDRGVLYIPEYDTSNDRRDGLRLKQPSGSKHVTRVSPALSSKLVWSELDTHTQYESES